tara:strand:+ start:22 stop:792 length:771 start_codon:yes stop_codon:yes gene_type:complete
MPWKVTMKPLFNPKGKIVGYGHHKEWVPEPNKPAPVTLKPLVNNKGKVVGYGHFKGNETQDKSKIPKKAPKTAAEKGALMAAVAATPKGQITAGATKKQAKVLPQNKKFNKYIKTKPTDGSAGDINQITTDYMKEGGDAGLGTGDAGLGALQDTFDKQIQDLKDAQTKANQLNQDALNASNAIEEAKLEEQKLLAKQKSMLGISSSAGKGGLKLGGLKTSGKASKSSKRKKLSSQQLSLQASLADALKVFGGPNLG